MTVRFGEAGTTIASTQSNDAKLNQQASATLPGNSTLRATATSKQLAFATLPGTSTLSATLSSSNRISVRFAGAGSFSAISVEDITVTVSWL